MWFEIEWYSYGPMFECLVISWWNCLGKNEDACSFWRRCVTGRGFWCFKSSCQVHFLSLIHLQLRDRCKLWGTAPAQCLQTAMHPVIMVMYTSSESINKSLIKCFILYVSLVMVVLCSNRKISKKILDWLICFQIIQASLQLITELRVTLNYRSLFFPSSVLCTGITDIHYHTWFARPRDSWTFTMYSTNWAMFPASFINLNCLLFTGSARVRMLI